jgi:lipopolysaccharide transport system ATP-binding protein
MNDTAINVQHLSKRYTIGAAVGQQTFREALISGAKAPLRRMRSALSGSGSVAATRDFWALRDISFEVKRGEVIGIVGRNGAGKSTLLKILSRITGPTGGYAEIHGRVGTLLEVGTGFHPELTGRENMYLNGAILGMSRADINRKFDEIVAFAEVEQFIDTMVKHYSSGMYLRLAFAVAAHLEPEILIVDEVLAVGDAQFQRKCLGKMGEVAKEGRTVLFVSHNMGAVRSLCSRAIWLHDGAVRMDTGTYEVIEKYLQQTLTPSSDQIDLRAVERSGDFGTRLKITGVRFNHGEPIMHGEQVLIDFEYEANTEAFGVAFGLGFASLEGTRLMTLDSDLEAPRYDLARNSRGVVRATLDRLMLQPGVYSLDIGARSGDGNALDYTPTCAQIEVLPGPRTPNMIIDLVGGVRVPALWAWPQDSVMEQV